MWETRSNSFATVSYHCDTRWPVASARFVICLHFNSALKELSSTFRSKESTANIIYAGLLLVIMKTVHNRQHIGDTHIHKLICEV